MPTIADWRGIENPPVNLPVVGSRMVMAYARVLIVTADGTSVTVTFPQIRSIIGFWITLLDPAANNLMGYGEAEGDTTGVDVTIGTGASSNVLTIADGQSQFNVTDTHLYHVLVVGPSKL